jgi:hypothetical protein
VAYSGKYRVKNPSKYLGDPSNVQYRSLWEYKVMKSLDFNPNVLSWGSEELVIPYLDASSGKWKNYYPDFVVKFIDNKGKIIKTIIEVKPEKQTHPPKEPKRKTKSYYNACNAYLMNMSKWDAAQKLCESKGWQWKILTENDLFK